MLEAAYFLDKAKGEEATPVHLALAVRPEYVSHATALRAIELAQAHAENYKHLLASALIKTTRQTINDQYPLTSQEAGL